MGGRRSSFLLLVFSLSPMKKAVLPRERMRRRRQCPHQLAHIFPSPATARSRASPPSPSISVVRPFFRSRSESGRWGKAGVNRGVWPSAGSSDQNALGCAKKLQVSLFAPLSTRISAHHTGRQILHVPTVLQISSHHTSSAH